MLEDVIALGVRVQAWRLPAELAEPHPVGEALTLDDLLDFHLLLQRDNWLAAVRACTESGR